MDLYVQSVAKNNGLYSICMLSVVYSAAGRLGYQEGKGKEDPLAKLAPDLPSVPVHFHLFCEHKLRFKAAVGNWMDGVKYSMWLLY